MSVSQIKHRRIYAAMFAVSGAGLLATIVPIARKVSVAPELVFGLLGPFAVGHLQLAYRVWRRKEISRASAFAAFAFDLATYVAIMFVIWLALTTMGADRSEKKGLMTASACLIAGLLLFAFRQRQRILYGISEVCVGVYLAYSKGVVAPDKLSDLAGDPAFVAAVVTASVYLIVRGCDNVQVGWKERRTKRMAAAATAGVPEGADAKQKPG